MYNTKDSSTISPFHDFQKQIRTQKNTPSHSLPENSYLHSNVRAVKKILEKYDIDEVTKQQVDSSCFIANLMKGNIDRNPSSIASKIAETIASSINMLNDTDSESISTHPKASAKDVRRLTDFLKEPKGNYLCAFLIIKSLPYLENGKSLLEEHEIDIEELEFLENSDDDEGISDTSTQEEEEHSSTVVSEKETVREYIERLLLEAKRNDPKNVDNYERMASEALERSLDSLKKACDSDDIKPEMFHMAQKRKIYDSMKRSIGQRSTSGFQPNPMETANSILSNLGMSPQSKSHSTSSSPINSPRGDKPKKTRKEIEELSNRLAKPKIRSKNNNQENDNQEDVKSTSSVNYEAREEFMNRMKQYQEGKRTKIENLKKQLEDKEMRHSFNPKINKNSKNIVRSVTSLMSWQNEKILKHEDEVRKKKEREAIVSCTFTPELSQKSLRMAKKRTMVLDVDKY